ncbi:MAG: CBS domain-containing protein [Gemmatimonadota bacterium]
MKLEDLLKPENIRIPLEAVTVGEGLRSLLPQDGSKEWGPDDGEALYRRLRSGEGGRARRVSPAALIVSLRSTEGDEPWAALGVSFERMGEPPEGDAGEPEPGPRILLVLRLPRGPGFGSGALEGLAAALREPEVRTGLLSAADPKDLTGIRRLLDVELDEPLRVEHVLTRMSYRVFPETPLQEVVDLMARRGLRALPVVGQDMQVLGIVTAGDALRHAVEGKGRGRETDSGGSDTSVRDIMSRTVMCVSEDQDLFDAAQLMVNRDVTQLPVLREGAIVGMLTQDAVLKALFGGR